MQRACACSGVWTASVAARWATSGRPSTEAKTRATAGARASSSRRCTSATLTQQWSTSIQSGVPAMALQPDDRGHPVGGHVAVGGGH